jgi:hypothetical protein
VLAQYQEIEEALRFEREQATASFETLIAPRMFKRVLLGMSIQVCCDDASMVAALG